MRGGVVVGLTLCGLALGCMKVALGELTPLKDFRARAEAPAVGVCPMVSAVATSRRGLVEQGAPMEPVVLPVMTYLVRVHGHLFLVDAGLVQAAERPASWVVSGLALGFSEAPHLTVAAQLERAGITPSMLSAVILTHAHLDHAGELESLPEVPVWLGREDVTWVSGLLPGRVELSTWRTVEGWEQLAPRLRPVDWGTQGRWGEFDQVNDVFGDGSLTLVHTPGHTPGSQSVLLRDGGRQVLLAGDVSISEHHIRGPVPKGLARFALDNSPAEAWETVQKMNRSIQNGTYEVFTAHDETLLKHRHRFEACARALVAGH